MNIEKKEKYTLITPDENSFVDFLETFQNKKTNFTTENIIINLIDTFDTKDNAIKSFLNYAVDKKEQGTSFVIVDTTANIDNFPETFNIAPTLEEAEDILEMELIARELGF